MNKEEQKGFSKVVRWGVALNITPARSIQATAQENRLKEVQ